MINKINQEIMFHQKKKEINKKINGKNQIKEQKNGVNNYH